MTELFAKIKQAEALKTEQQKAAEEMAKKRLAAGLPAVGGGTGTTYVEGEGDQQTFQAILQSGRGKLTVGRETPRPAERSPAP